MAKPTPTKLVLLMSAAGLTLSWSGLAYASRDESVAPDLNFGTTPREQQNCKSGAAATWMSCLAADGELVRTLVTQTDRLPPPLASISPASESIAGAQAAMAGAVAASSQRPSSAAGDEEATKLAWVLLDDVQAITELSPIPTKSRAVATPPAARDAKAAAGTGTPDNALKVEPVVVDALDHGTTTADSTALDRVFASLVAVLGADIDAAPVAATSDSASALAVTHAPEAVALADRPDSAAAKSDQVLPTFAQAVVAAMSQPTPTDSAVQERPSERRTAQAVAADDIVVAASHSDKVLMDLQELRAADVEPVARGAGAKKKAVVASHGDKVLETLALFHSRASDRADRADRAAHACTRANGSAAVGVAGVAGVATPAAQSAHSAADEALARLGLELDIDLDFPVASALDATSGTRPMPTALAEAIASERGGDSALGGELVALRTDELDQVRGGFVTDGGLKISFGIERAVYLNGTLVTTTSLNIADLAKISGGQAQVTSNGFGSVGLVQSGPGNVFMPGAISMTAAGLVIQNTLDNQKINTITRIDAVVNSASILRSMNLQSSMRSAIVDSLRR